MIERRDPWAWAGVLGAILVIGCAIGTGVGLGAAFVWLAG